MLYFREEFPSPPGVTQALKVLAAEPKWSAPQILAKLMSAASGVRSYRQPIMARAGISPPLRPPWEEIQDALGDDVALNLYRPRLGSCESRVSPPLKQLL